MAENRPTPRYGELAPEGWVWSPPSDPDEKPNAAPDAGADASGIARPTEEPAPQKPYRIADATLSVFLLVMGLLTSTSSVPALFALRSTIDRFYADRGLDEYGGGSAVDIAGAIAAVSQLALLAAAIWLTVRLIGQRRRSWPVPLLLGALALIVVFACLTVALVADPGLVSSLSSS